MTTHTPQDSFEDVVKTSVDYATWRTGGIFDPSMTREQAKQAILAAHKAEVDRAVAQFIDDMLIDERGNDAAGHKWSRGDFMKYLKDSQAAIPEEAA